MTRSIIIALSILTLYSCSPGVLPTSSSERYKEDLSVLRPKYPSRSDSSKVDDTELVKDYDHIEPQYDVTETLNMTLDSIDVLNSNLRFINGYTIQIYSGSNSEIATKTRGKVYSILPGASPRLKFEEPNFKVKVGKYYSRLEAQGDYHALHKRFPTAIIIPERLYIK